MNSNVYIYIYYFIIKTYRSSIAGVEPFQGASHCWDSARVRGFGGGKPHQADGL